MKNETKDWFGVDVVYSHQFELNRSVAVIVARTQDGRMVNFSPQAWSELKRKIKVDTPQ